MIPAGMQTKRRNRNNRMVQRTKKRGIGGRCIVRLLEIPTMPTKDSPDRHQRRRNHLRATEELQGFVELRSTRHAPMDRAERFEIDDIPALFRAERARTLQSRSSLLAFP